MRDIFFTAAEVNEARATLLPQLRAYAAECRQQRPLPALNTLTLPQRAQYDILRERMASFTPYSPFREDCVCILHSSPVGLLAAQDVFAEAAHGMVCLLPDERKAWFDRLGRHVDGWCWLAWWTIHETVPDRLREFLAEFPDPGDAEYWDLVHGRGSTAFHELWTWDGATARQIGELYAVCAEHGPIDEWYE